MIIKTTTQRLIYIHLLFLNDIKQLLKAGGVVFWELLVEFLCITGYNTFDSYVTTENTI